MLLDTTLFKKTSYPGKWLEHVKFMVFTHLLQISAISADIEASNGLKICLTVQVNH